VWSFTNLVLAANSSCVAAMPNVTGTNFLQASDVSGVASITQNPTNGAMLPLGTNVVVITVADTYGNTVYSTNVILVADRTPPVVTLDGSNPMTNQLGVPFIDPGLTASDACSGVALLATNGAVNVDQVGTYSVTYTAVDGSGNTNAATRVVVVVDTVPPTIVWSFTNLVLAANSNCMAVMPDVAGTNYVQASDLSGVASVTQNPTNGAVLPLGSNVVVMAVADSYGNTAYSTNTVVVRDGTPPQILFQPQSQTNTVGESVTFDVVATACTPLSFLWISNNIPLAAETNSTLVLTSLDYSAAGSYVVVVSAAGGSVTSSVVELTITAPLPPAINGVTINPVGSVTLNLFGAPGSTYILQAATNLSPPVSWLQIATNTLGGSGLWLFTDQHATNFPQQFYRLLLAP
jgi:hypothetical protein